MQCFKKIDICDIVKIHLACLTIENNTVILINTVKLMNRKLQAGYYKRLLSFCYFSKLCQ